MRRREIQCYDSDVLNIRHIFLILALLAAGWILGVKTQSPDVKILTVEVPSTPIVQEKVRVEEIEVEKPVFIDRIRYIERDIGTAVRLIDYVYTDLADWESVGELQAFLDADDTDTDVIMTNRAGGVIEFNGQCEDYAIQLRARAAAIGKNLEVIAIDSTEYNKWLSYFGGSGITSGTYHALNMAIIGNEIWYVEPQKDLCWHALNLD
jgi:hypothetical protein